MNKDHPSHEAVIAWANGESIQYRYIGHCNDDDWYDWDAYGIETPFFTRFDWEWRPKPKMKKIVWRTFLYKSNNRICVDVVTEDDLKIYNPECGSDFVCWCEDDWQMIEVELLTDEK